MVTDALGLAKESLPLKENKWKFQGKEETGCIALPPKSHYGHFDVTLTVSDE